VSGSSGGPSPTEAQNSQPTRPAVDARTASFSSIGSSPVKRTASESFDQAPAISGRLFMIRPSEEPSLGSPIGSIRGTLGKLPPTIRSIDTYSATTLGVMVDETFAVLVNPVRPPGRSVVSTEISIDLAGFSGRGLGSVRADGEVLIVSEGGALARASITDETAAVVAVATSRCRFLEDDEAAGRTPAPEPPADLSVASLITTDLHPEANEVRASFVPDQRCANDLGFLHGGIAAAAILEVGLSWLRMIHGDAAASSVRLNFLQPVALGEMSTIEARPLHVGRTSGITAITTRDPAGKLAIASTVSGMPAGV
jgi:uncharacterized protein (TIGR00369 family)